MFSRLVLDVRAAGVKSEPEQGSFEPSGTILFFFVGLMWVNVCSIAAEVFQGYALFFHLFNIIGYSICCVFICKKIHKGQYDMMLRC